MKSKISQQFSTDRVFLAIIVLLTTIGVFVFISASFGLTLEKEVWKSILISQLILGLGMGVVFALLASVTPVSFLKKYALYLLISAIIMNLLVFVPEIGFRYGGAARWIHVFGISFQPVEFLKVALVIFLAKWLSHIKDDVKKLRYGLAPFLFILAIIAVIMISQPDTGSFIIILGTSIVMFFSAWGRLSHIASVAVGTIFLITVLAFTRPYVKSRITVFFNPSHDPSGESYQLQQSLLAVGSGELTGRGFGQSLQKFRYLPEPIGDSIFSVLGEEFGFIGTTTIVLLFIAYCLRGLRIASRAENLFDRLLVTGLAIMVAIQAFMHIGASLGLLPLTGIPLPFISHGGSAMMFALIGAGLIINISRHKQGV